MLEISFASFYFIRFLEIAVYLYLFFNLLKQPVQSKIIISFFTAIPLTLAFIFLGPIAYLVLFATLFIVNHNQKKDKLVFTMILCWLIIYIQGLFYSNFYLQVLKNQSFIKQEGLFIIVYSTLLIMVIFPIYYLVKILLKKLDNFVTVYLKNNYIYYLISLPVIFLILITLYVQFAYKDSDHIIIVITLFSLVFLSISLITSFYFLVKTKKDFEFQQEKEELNQLISYTEKLESNQQQLRKFKHDYLNIILSLQSAIETENITTIKNEFSKISQYSSDTLKKYPTNLNDLSNINVLAIKSIFLSKLLYWDKELTENITIECQSLIENFYINDIILVRILGNLLDNAYEEIEQQKGNTPFIRIAIIDEKDTIDIIIENSFNNKPIHLKTLSTPHFSTKENHSGLGLTTVSQLVADNDKLNLLTSINAEKKIFSINLLIEKS
ncbi:MAG: GHKL domain-containing protein [Bacilli bacterium]